MITGVSLIYVQHLVTVGYRRYSRHMRVISRCCTFLNNNQSIHSLPFFIAHFHRSNVWTEMMVDGSNDASWPGEVPFGYADAKKIFLGNYGLSVTKITYNI